MSLVRVGISEMHCFCCMALSFLLCFACQIAEGKSRWVLSPDRYISCLEPYLDQTLRSSLADSVLKLGIDHEIDPCLQEATLARLENLSLFCLGSPYSSNSGKLAHIFCIVSNRIIVCICILHSVLVDQYQLVRFSVFLSLFGAGRLCGPINEATLLIYVAPKVANTKFTYILSQHFSKFSPALLSITFV